MKNLFLGIYGLACASGVYCFYKINHYNNILYDLTQSDLTLNQLTIKYPELKDD